MPNTVLDSIQCLVGHYDRVVHTARSVYETVTTRKQLLRVQCMIEQILDVYTIGRILLLARPTVLL